jgi:nicotinamidase-related amidase
MKTMSKKVLVVVDMQKDFIDGSLGTKEAVGIVEKVADKIKGFDGEIVFTRDTHFENYLDTQEGKNLPVKHCIKDTEGWQINDQLQTLRTPQMKVFDKLTFGSVELAEYLKAQSDLESVELVGLCTDICVISNAMVIKAFLPELPICVDSSCCAGVTPESHLRAIEAMKMCQITIL